MKASSPFLSTSILRPVCRLHVAVPVLLVRRLLQLLLEPVTPKYSFPLFCVFPPPLHFIPLPLSSISCLFFSLMCSLTNTTFILQRKQDIVLISNVSVISRVSSRDGENTTSGLTPFNVKPIGDLRDAQFQRVNSYVCTYTISS